MTPHGITGHGRASHDWIRPEPRAFDATGDPRPAAQALPGQFARPNWPETLEGFGRSGSLTSLPWPLIIRAIWLENHKLASTWDSSVSSNVASVVTTLDCMGGGNLCVPTTPRWRSARALRCTSRRTAS